MSSDVHPCMPNGRSLWMTDNRQGALEAFANPRRSTVLSVLRDREQPLSVSELAASVAERESATEGADDRGRAAVRLSIYHTHLPKLADHGIVEWNPNDPNVSLTASSREWVGAVLDSPLGDPAFYRALADPRRRSVLAAVLESEDPIGLADLAVAVGAHEQNAAPETLTETERDRIAVSLHHADLPALETAGLLEYDADERVVDPSTLAPFAER